MGGEVQGGAGGYAVSAAKITERLKQAYDRTWYEAVYREMLHTYGQDYASGHSATGSVFTLFPDVTAETEKVGQVRKTLRAAVVARARLMSSEPEPELGGLDEIESQIWKGFWSARWRGEGDRYGSYAPDAQDAWLDGWMHGIGCLQVGMATVDKAGESYQKVTVRHSSLTCTVWDPVVRDPRQSRFVAFAHVMAAEDARNRFGEHVANHVQKWANQWEYVLLFEYFDVGIGGEGPKHAWIAGDLGNSPFVVRPNPFGATLPAVWMTNVLMPGMRRHIGQVALQRATETAINQVVEYIRKVFKRGPGQRFVNTLAVPSEQVGLLRQGNPDQILEYSPVGGEGTPMFEARASEVPVHALQLLEKMEQEFNEAAGQSELERGTLASGNRTAYEIETLQAAVAANNGGVTFFTTTFLRELIEKVYAIGRQYDTCPFDVMVMGEPVTFNDPEDKRSWMSLILQKPVKVTVGSEALTAADNDSKRLRRLALLEKAFPLVQAGVVDAHKYARYLLQTLGMADVETWLAQQPVQDPAAMAAEQGLAVPPGPSEAISA